ncbi:TetR family transcriptional regulator [Chelatococcus reniformis]|uniref:TetR family transcriptional regulator n=1 Tax=Chelatococcus reniformis TaxID=1494448 RepID=A0A916U6E8_9HYPH|nr:TetR family transcriptional regulator [Chelatococcus reniformis]
MRTKVAREAAPKPSFDRGAAREQREAMILDEAIRFFADVGFAGQTRELARRLGLTQPALYKYFQSKEELIEKVYQRVFISRWKSEWERMLTEPAVPLKDKLERFYLDYARIVVEHNFIRITMQAALAGDRLTSRYVTQVGERIVPRVCHAVREAAGLPPIADGELSARELQTVWDLQGAIIYLAVRHHIYGFAPLEPLETSVRGIVATFIAGAPQVFGELARVDAGETVRKARTGRKSGSSLSK